MSQFSIFLCLMCTYCQSWPLNWEPLLLWFGVNQMHGFHVRNTSDTQRCFTVYRKLEFTKRKIELTLVSFKDGPVYRSALEQPWFPTVLKNIHPSFLPLHLSYCPWWTAHCSLESSTWIVSVPSVLSERCTFDLVELGEGLVPVTQLLLGWVGMIENVRPKEKKLEIL